MKMMPEFETSYSTNLMPFTIAAVPQVYQGAGSIKKLSGWLKDRGYAIVGICTGGNSLTASPAWQQLCADLEMHNIAYTRYSVQGEPSPESVDDIARNAALSNIQCIVGIGGGSVMDTAKAVAAMVPLLRNESESHPYAGVQAYLEGVGTLSPPPARLGLAAVPTTAGTGSEATKNAVISKIGKGGFKKSLRHDKYVPDLAILDGELFLGCPQSITAASGLDAVTQLLESYVSTESTIFTDALAETGLRLAGKAFPRVCADGYDLQARSEMAYAAYLSGITLANANLGVVHGAAGVLGGVREIPHGTACGTLLYSATRMIVEKLEAEAAAGSDSAAVSLRKYGRAGSLLNIDKKCDNVKNGVTLLLDTLVKWQETYAIPSLSTFGFTIDELKELAGKTDRKKTPVVFTVDEIRKIFTDRL
jgi:alcohol dehydrogenase class IV